MKIEDYKIGQKVSLNGYIEAIDIANIHNKENTTILSIKTVTGKISVNPKWEKVKIDQPKTLVPQCVFDMIEKYKNENRSFYAFIENTPDVKEVWEWLNMPKPGIKESELMQAWLAYPNISVEKEKLYTVEILDKTLVKVIKEDSIYFYKMSSHFLDNKMQILKNLTESEIKQADERLWEWAKEVKE